MPFTLAVLVVGVVLGYLAGGRLRALADADLHATWLLFAGLAVQVAVAVGAAQGLLAGAVGTALLVGSQIGVAAWAGLNRTRPGMWLVGAGLALNAAVVAANGAMPVSPAAIAAAGLRGEPPPGKHELMTNGTHLPWLADVIPVPPLRTVLSVGDLLLAAGVVPLVVHLMRSGHADRRRGGPR